MFPVILEEIQRTSCQPREVCVEVAKEYPEPTSQFYLPRCVALHRCGGCCPNEAFYCTNTSHTLVNKTVSGAAGLIYSVFLHVTDFLALYYTIVLVFSPLRLKPLQKTGRTQKTLLTVMQHAHLYHNPPYTAAGRPLAATGHQVIHTQSRTTFTH